MPDLGQTLAWLTQTALVLFRSLPLRVTTWYHRLVFDHGKDQTMEATEVDVQAYEDSDERAPHAVTCAIGVADYPRHSHSYGAVECVTGAETVAAEAFATGAGLGRVGIIVTRLNGSGVFASFTPDDANRLAHDLLEACARAKGYQRDMIGHDDG